MYAKKIIFVSLLILFYSFCFSQDYWESIYSSEDNIHCLAINSIGYLFVGSQNGIHRSIDNGINWENVGLENMSVYCLTINSNDDILAGTGGFNTIYLSEDNGENWIPKYSSISNVVSIFINSNSYIFAGMGGDYGIIRSIDYGENWDVVLSLSDNEQVNSICEKLDGALFTGTTDFMGGGGIYRSIDQGDSWELVGMEYHFFSSLAVNSNDEIFAGSRGHYTQGIGGVYHSNGNGENWDTLTNEFYVNDIAIDSENRIFIGCAPFNASVRFSEDNGETWQLIESEVIPWQTEINFINIYEDDYIYVISYGGLINEIFRSVQPTGILENYEIPTFQNIKLNNYPNPFNPVTTISFNLPLNVKNPVIEISNIRGEKVRQFSILKSQSSIVWDGNDDSGNPVSSGVYLYKLSVDGKSKSVKKCLMLK